MQHSTGSFQDGIFYQCWDPKPQLRAVIAIVHGVLEHSGRNANVVNFLVPHGYALWAFDLRGHGRSPGQRGYIQQWSEFRKDLGAFLELIRTRDGDTPVFLLGHSMGGLIALEYCLHYPEGLQGVILSGPAIGEISLSPLLRKLSWVLDLIWPSMPLTPTLDISAISRDPAVIQGRKEDPLVHQTGTPRLAMEIMKAIAWVQAHADELRLPMLIVQGTADRLTHPDGSRS